MLTYMRRLVNFIVCIGLICAGAYFVYGEVFVRFSGRSKLLVVGLVLSPAALCDCGMNL